MPSPPLKQLGKYQLVDILGEGAMGVVYRAYDQVLNRYLAIKVMSSAIGNNAQLRERFLREARAAGSLQHPNVVTIYDFGEEDDHLFIAMEFVDGVDLAEIIRRRDDLALTTKLDIMIDMLNGLAYAHNRGVVHRDIKPANIRVTTDTRAKLMDFGIAYLQQSELTQSGVLVGTPQYMAPEQVSGGAITAATDVFAAGSVLYEFVTQRRPFEGETLHVILYNIMSTEPPSITELMPKAPAGLDAVIKKALAKDPAARYDSAVSMSKALSGIRQSISPLMDAATLSLRTSHSPAGPPPATALRTSQIQGMIATEVARRQKRTTWVAVGGAAAAVLATVLLLPKFLDAPNNGPQANAAVGDNPSAPTAPAPGPTGNTGQVDSPQVAVIDTTPRATPPAARGNPGSPPQQSSSRGSALTEGRGRQGVPPAGAAPPPVLDTASLRVIRTTAEEARRGAVQDGATAAELARGDGSMREANQAQSQGREQGTIVSLLSTATTAFNEAARAARLRIASEAAARQAAAQPPPVVTPPPVRPETTARAADPRPDIERAIAAYAAALQSENIANVRTAYPGLTAQQAGAWQGLFGAAENLRITHTITSLDVTGASATARVNAELQFRNTTTRREENQRSSYTAILTREGETWRITRIN